MKIELDLSQNLGIKNFKSFDEEGIYVDSLSKINMFIGKNNCGKSNILKFIKTLSEKQGAFGSFPHTPDIIPLGSTYHTKIFFKFSHSALNFPRYYVREDQRSQIRLDTVLDDPLTVEFEMVNQIFKIKGWKQSGQLPYEKKFHKDEDFASTSILNHLNINAQGYLNLWDAVEHHFKEKFANAIKNHFSDVVYIPDFRRISKKKSEDDGFTSAIGGNNIIKELHMMINPKFNEDDKQANYRKIKNTIGDLLGENDITLEVPYTLDQIILKIDGRRLPLENLGTGIHEMVLLTCSIILHPESIVCLEEPEIHLYPDLQRRFIKFLLTTPNRYFITTHSNVFLDENNSDISIFHIKHQNNRSTVAAKATTGAVKTILEDLGYKASDLLQSNGIIWVEGPSDRIFLNRWLALAKSPYEEGSHFSIMFYGGKLLSHLSFKEDLLTDQFIKLLRINRNAFILIDRDSIDGDINDTKRRISTEIGENNSWITQGREIENYLSMDSINRWMKSKSLNPIGQEVQETDKFDEVLQKVNPTLVYSRKKAAFSHEIASHVEQTDLSRLDIAQYVERIISAIEKWNK